MRNPATTAKASQRASKAGATQLPESKNDRSRERILRGALRAISMRGPASLSMVDVCGAAGISRATLYRHFTDKDELLAAVAIYVNDSFTKGVKQIAAKVTDPVDLVREFLEFTSNFTAKVHRRELLEVEPRFVIQFLESHFAEHIATWNEVLGPAYDALDQAFGTQVDRSLLSEFLIRGQESTVLIRAGSRWADLPTTLVGALGAIIAQRRPARKR